MTAPTITTFAQATECLKAALPGYEERPEQTRLATAIEQSLEDGSILLAQAGTGTGKSLASLIPAILSGGTAVYSTASKALQAQIVDKDLPFLKEHLGVSFEYAMLQGRKNYLCRERLLNADNIDQSLRTKLLAVVQDSDARPEDEQIQGLRDEFPAVDASEWNSVTVGSDDCLGKDCPFFEECYVTQAKRKAAQANVIVVNHAMLMSDAYVRSQTGGDISILPPYDALIVDEAHELEEYATSALARDLRPNSVPKFASDFTALVRRNDIERAEDAEDLRNSMTARSGDLFFQIQKQEGRIRHRWFVDHADNFFSVTEPIAQAVEMLSQSLEALLSGVFEPPRKLVTAYRRMISRGLKLIESLKAAVMLTDAEVVRFTETDDRFGTVLRSLPVRVGPWLAEHLWPECNPVLLSATLFVDGSADYAIDRYGLDLAEREVRMIDSGTPFDYDRQLTLYVPSHIPEPTPKNKEQWTNEMVPLIIELVKASRGRALVLFTSAAQMREVHRRVAPHIDQYPIRKQGDDSTAALTRWFRETVDGVLFATRTFFTGIDIQGESLSMVIIDKLPFPVPTDPVIEARSEEIEARGKSAFSEYTVPIMALTLLQAHGRLIRTKKDKGVVAILDPRLWSKGYGKTIMRSLPGKHSRDLNDVDRMFEV